MRLAVKGYQDAEIKKTPFGVLPAIVYIASTFSFELFKTVLGNFVTMVGNWIGKYENICRVSASSWSYEEGPGVPNTLAYAKI